MLIFPQSHQTEGHLLKTIGGKAPGAKSSSNMGWRSQGGLLEGGATWSGFEGCIGVCQCGEGVSRRRNNMYKSAEMWEHMVRPRQKRAEGVEWRRGRRCPGVRGCVVCLHTFLLCTFSAGYEISLHLRVRLCGKIYKPLEVGQGREKQHRAWHSRSRSTATHPRPP